MPLALSLTLTLASQLSHAVEPIHVPMVMRSPSIIGFSSPRPFISILKFAPCVPCPHIMIHDRDAKTLATPFYRYLCSGIILILCQEIILSKRLDY